MQHLHFYNVFTDSSFYAVIYDMCYAIITICIYCKYKFLSNDEFS